MAHDVTARDSRSRNRQEQSDATSDARRFGEREPISNGAPYRSGIGAVANNGLRCRFPQAYSPDAEHRAALRARRSSSRACGVARHDLASTPFDVSPHHVTPRTARHRSTPSCPPRRLRRRLGAPARAGRRPSTRDVLRRSLAGAPPSCRSRDQMDPARALDAKAGPRAY